MSQHQAQGGKGLHRTGLSFPVLAGTLEGCRGGGEHPMAGSGRAEVSRGAGAPPQPASPIPAPHFLPPGASWWEAEGQWGGLPSLSPRRGLWSTQNHEDAASSASAPPTFGQTSLCTHPAGQICKTVSSSDPARATAASSPDRTGPWLWTESSCDRKKSGSP